MNIKSPAEWTDELVEYWKQLSRCVRYVIIFCAAEMVALALLVSVANAACVTGRGGDVEYALHDCAIAPPHCLRGVYPSADTLALINGSPVSPRRREQILT